MNSTAILTTKHTEHLSELLHLVIDDLIELHKIDCASDQLQKKFNFQTAEDFDFTIKFISSLYKKYCLNEINDVELVSHFVHLKKMQQVEILAIIKSRKLDVYPVLLKDLNLNGTQSGRQILESFDWNVKWIMGDSAIATVRRQIATIFLNCRLPKSIDGERDGLSQVFFEVDKDKLCLMISILEECQKKLNE